MADEPKMVCWATEGVGNNPMVSCNTGYCEFHYQWISFWVNVSCTSVWNVVQKGYRSLVRRGTGPKPNPNPNLTLTVTVTLRLYNFRTSDPSDQWPVPVQKRTVHWCVHVIFALLFFYILFRFVHVWEQQVITSKANVKERLIAETSCKTLSLPEVLQTVPWQTVKWGLGYAWFKSFCCV